MDSQGVILRECILTLASNQVAQMRGSSAVQQFTSAYDLYISEYHVSSEKA
jgi:hypothetical protein